MSTTTTSTEWFHHFYTPAAPSTAATPPSDSTVISTVPTPTTDVSSRPGPGVNAGRVTRPARRRPRASRKNPTTLLNTDTTNFRAMVQRYTGGAAFESAPQPSRFNVGFHQGQMGNYNPLLELQASQALQHQVLMQQHGFGSTVDVSASSARGYVAQPGAELDRLYPSSAENKRDGFMF